MITDGLTEKLRAALAIPADESVDVETPLIDQGVDSLVAVAIRTWYGLSGPWSALLTFSKVFKAA